jgi:hypothetical protein
LPDLSVQSQLLFNECITVAGPNQRITYGALWRTKAVLFRKPIHNLVDTHGFARTAGSGGVRHESVLSAAVATGTWTVAASDPPQKKTNKKNNGRRANRRIGQGATTCIQASQARVLFRSDAGTCSRRATPRTGHSPCKSRGSPSAVTQPTSTHSVARELHSRAWCREGHRGRRACSSHCASRAAL